MDDIADRIEKLKRKAAALSGGRMISGFAPDCSPEIQEQFWNNVLEFEEGPEVAPFDELLRAGVTLPPAEELDDGALAARLWEVIRGLEDLGVYLEFTDHLSDRELYTSLWSKVLREPMALTPDDLNAAWHIDLTIAGRDDDGVDVYLTYYADEEMRRRWAEDDPEFPIPPSKPLPFDRDRHLPSQWARPVRTAGDDARMS
jgi:hypothetical protein